MVGRAVSHYHILEKIGAGGMGEVYLAEDTKLGRKVALKFLPTQLTKDPEAKKRFVREARASAPVDHPNICSVYEVGEHDGQVFIAMGYFAGRTLKEIIDAGARRAVPLPIADVIAIATQIAADLPRPTARASSTATSSRSHRDPPGQPVKIVDFGLAKLRGFAPDQGILHAGHGYMSPEQALGKEVDPRSDIWSLGVVIYEMVSGELPFRGEYDQAVIYAIINEEMLPLAVGNAASAAMGNVIRRCLAKKRQDRYPSAEALAGALRDLGGAKENTHPEKRRGRLFYRRAFLAGLSLLLLSGILVFLALNPRASGALKRVLGLGGIPGNKHIAVLPLVTNDDPEAKALARQRLHRGHHRQADLA